MVRLARHGSMAGAEAPGLWCLGSLAAAAAEGWADGAGPEPWAKSFRVEVVRGWLRLFNLLRWVFPQTVFKTFQCFPRVFEGCPKVAMVFQRFPKVSKASQGFSRLSKGFRSYCFRSIFFNISMIQWTLDGHLFSQLNLRNEVEDSHHGGFPTSPEDRWLKLH